MITYSDWLDLAHDVFNLHDIQHLQNERWSRLRKWRNMNGLSMMARHTFMYKEIELLRSGKRQIKSIKAKMN